MTRVFLSYASANSAVAAQLTREWRRRGAEVFQFGEPEQQGEIIVEQIEREMSRATICVVLMSPAYLASPWCRIESRLAIHRANESHRANGSTTQFIYVVEVDATAKNAGGTLGTYSWVNALGDLTAARLDEISAALPLGHGSTGGGMDDPVFRNRDDELTSLLGALRTTGGRDLWVVVAPPRMGKTWLLAEVEKRLVRDAPPWSVRRLDLRHEPVDLRYDPTRLVTALLQVDGMAQGGLEEGNLRSIALAVSSRGERLLFMLDSAELLTPTCATAAREALTAIHQTVRIAGHRGRYGLVVATRRHDEWRGMGRNPRTGRRFEPLHLSEFGVEVVYQALLDLPNDDIGAEKRWAYAACLQRLSEGLPALLVRSVQWAVGTGFLGDPSDSDNPAAFNEVARSYVYDDLLSADSLLPLGAARPEAALAVLRGALRALSTYRLYTQSHLAFHLEADPGLQQALDEAGWTADDLWSALGRTALQSTKKSNEIWHEIERPLRRLLHRYHHPADVERCAAHTTARRFYGGWAKDRAAGREQQVVLAECLWHEAARLTIDEPSTVQETLPRLAAEFARDCGHGPMYKPAEFREAVSRRLVADDELQELLGDHEGLFATIVESVTDVIGGDE